MNMPREVDFEAIIGLEVHAQLSTDSKIFCGCRARLQNGKSVADLAPNSNTCPICSGQPGVLPVLNRKVVEFAIRAGLALNCRINRVNVFARKNYFYPDLPKGYQISQYELPICEDGWLELATGEGTSRQVTIQRIHMEEDAGKNIHMPGYSLVDLNRAGVPLIEIVSGPDLRTPAEASSYLRTLHAVVTYLGICDGNMQEGNFRCDVNVSVRPKGVIEFGTRTEIKNVNSFKFVEKALEYEIRRQIEVVRSGGVVQQETRTYDEARNATVPMRTKEEAHDYRYFPEPDLLPVNIDESLIEEIRAALPELPEQKKQRFIDDFGLSSYDARVLTASRRLSEFFEEAVRLIISGGMDIRLAAKPAANLITGEVSHLLNEKGIEIDQSRLRPEHIAEIVRLTRQNTVSAVGAKQIIASAWESGEDVGEIVERQGLRQVSDVSALEPVIDQVVAAFPDQVAEYRAGKEKLIGFFVGQAMRRTGGKANPALLQELLRRKLSC